MALDQTERDEIEASDEGVDKLTFLDAIPDIDLEDLLGANLLDIDGNPATSQEKNKFRRKRLNRFGRYNKAEKLRADVNIINVSGGTLTLASFEDYSAYETQLIRAYAKKLEAAGGSFSKPRSAIQALDVDELDAALKVIAPTATNGEIRALIKAIAKY